MELVQEFVSRAARSIAAGTWSFIGDIQVTNTAGTSASADVSVSLTRRNASCVIQETILSGVIANVPKGINDDRTLTVPGVPQIDFAPGDILVLEVTATSSTATGVRIRHDRAAGTNRDSRIVHPGEAGASP